MFRSSTHNGCGLLGFPERERPESGFRLTIFHPTQLGAEFIDVVVDGEVTSLGPKYAVGAVTPNLPSGGSSYTVVAAFLTPPSTGAHIVTIRVLFSGGVVAPDGFAFETTYTVNVR